MSYFGNYNERFTLIDKLGIANQVNFALDIPEPELFGEVDFTSTRSKKWFSFNNEFLDSKNLTLKFDRVSAEGATNNPFDFIKAIIALAGYDATVNLRAYRTPKNGSESYKEWNLDLKTFRETEVSLEVKIKRVDFSDKLRTRFDAVIDVESSTDLDGDAILPASLFSIPLHSRLVLQETQAESVGFKELPWSVTQNSRTVVEASVGIPDEINEAETFTAPTDVNLGDLTQEEIPESVTPFMEFKYDGTAYLVPRIYMSMYDDLSFGSDIAWSIQITLYLDVYYGKELLSHTLLETYSQSATSTFAIAGNSFNSVQAIDVRRGQKAYLYFVINYSNAYGSYAGDAHTERQASEISIEYKTKTSASLCEGLLVGDLSSKLIQKASGTSFYDPLRSDLMRQDCSALNFITTGSKIRGLDKPLSASLKDVFGFVRNRYCAGFSIVRVGSRTYIDFEKIDHFFTDTKILTLSKIQSLSRIANEDIAVNSIRVGYANYSNPDKAGGRDGFNTERGYLTPITSFKKELSLMTENMCLDGAEIERIKRLELNTLESDSADDKLFCVKLIEYTNNRRFDPGVFGDNDEVLALIGSGGNRVTVVGLILHTLIVGDRLVWGSNLHTINDISLNYRDNKTVLTVAGSVSSGTSFLPFHFVNSDNQNKSIFIPERIEPFSTVYFVSDENYEYNIDHAPSNSLFEWFKYYGGFLSKKKTFETLKVTDTKNNARMHREYESSSCAPFDGVLGEDDALPISLLSSKNPALFSDDVYEIECYLNYDEEYVLLEEALNGEAGPEDYGYIEFEYDGETKQAYPVSISHKKETMLTSIVCWGKAE